MSATSPTDTSVVKIEGKHAKGGATGQLISLVSYERLLQFLQEWEIRNANAKIANAKHQRRLC